MDDNASKPKFKLYKKNYKKTFKKAYEKKEFIYDEKKLYNYGINRLYSRDYGRKELALKMARFQKDQSIIDQVLDQLEEQGYLSDERRIRSMLSQYDSRESVNKTKNRLVQKGLNKEQVQEVIEKKQTEQSFFSVVEEAKDIKEIETDKAKTILIKKFKSFDKDNWDKMVRFLASRGFSYDHISKAIKSFKEDE